MLCDVDDAARGVAAGIVSDGGEAIFQDVDVRSLEQLHAAVGTAEATFGRLDTVVANAGTVGGAAVAHRLEDLGDDQSGVDHRRRPSRDHANVRRGHSCAATGWRRRDVSHRVDRRPHRGGGAGGVQHVEGWDRQRGADAPFELVADNIRVNCVCPGGVETNLLSATDILPILMAQMEASQPEDQPTDPTALMNRAAAPEEVANVHRFLVSNDASLVNGQPVVCDAGSMVANLWMVIDR